MAYEKITWVSGTTPLSAENMNHMEEGIAASNEGVDKLNTDKSVAVTADTTKASFQILQAKKYGKIVVLSARFSLISALSSGSVVIAKVPDQDNIAAYEVANYGNRQDSGNIPFSVITGSSGNITIKNLGVTLTTGINYCFELVWVTN